MGEWGCWEACFLKIDPVIPVVLHTSTYWDSKDLALQPVNQLCLTLYCFNVTLRRHFNFHPASIHGVTSLSVIYSIVLHPDQQLAPPPGSQTIGQQLWLKDITLTLFWETTKTSTSETKQCELRTLYLWASEFILFSLLKLWAVVG